MMIVIVIIRSGNNEIHVLVHCIAELSGEKLLLLLLLKGLLLLLNDLLLWLMVSSVALVGEVGDSRG